MELIFLCGLFPKNREKSIFRNSKDVIHSGPNNLQWAFVNGLKDYFKTFLIVTSPLLTNYPKSYRKLVFWGSYFVVDENIKGVCLGSIRLPLIGLVSKSINMTWFLFRNYTSKKNIQILVYSVHIPYLVAAVLFKVFNRSTKICLFVNDLPQYMSNNSNKVYLFFKSIELFSFKIFQNFVDSYIFVTIQTNNLINTKEKPWVLIEGIFDVDTHYESLIESENLIGNNIVLYTGTLDSRYGIKHLIDAFDLIKFSDFELWICGDGELKYMIQKLASRNNKIKYFGLLNHSQTIELQKSATVLVNPRQTIGEYTKYSFPIKTLEYLASGKPCIMYDLPGLPREYLDFLIVPKNESVQELSDTIIEVCRWDLIKRNKFCHNAFNFIKYYKSSNFQFKKIKNLIDN